MSYHRLTAPGYIGGLPVGYDYLNNLLVGTPSPVDPTKASGVNLGTYFVAFGEDGRAAAVNRGLAALAANTDAIDDFMHADVAVLTFLDVAASTSATIPASATEPTFVGPPGTPNNQTGLEPYFHVTDQSNNDIVDLASNNQVVVTSAAAPIGTNFFPGPINLTLNITPSVPYRVWYAKRSSLIEMKKENFIRSSIWGIQHKQAGLLQFINNLKSTVSGQGSGLVGVNNSTYGATSVTYLAGGGLGSPTTVEGAIQAANDQLIRRRTYTAVLTDGTSSAGGDYNGQNIDTVLNTFTLGGKFHLRPYNFTVGNGVSSPYVGNLRFDSEVGYTGAGLILDPTRTANLTLTGRLELDNTILSSSATSGAHWILSPSAAQFGLTVRNNYLIGGAVAFADTGPGGMCMLDNAPVSNWMVGSTAAAGLDVNGNIRTHIKNLAFTDATDGTKPQAYFRNIQDSSKGGMVLVENCTFSITVSASGANALDLNGVYAPVTFRNCHFEITQTNATGYAAKLVDCNVGMIRFENCVFKSSNGMVFKASNSGVQLVGCYFYSTSTLTGTATSSMISIDPNGLSTVENCRAVIGTSSVLGGAGTAAYPVIELGGAAGTPANDGYIHVNGFYVQLDPGNTNLHNYSTMVLHGGKSVGTAYNTQNVYRNVFLTLGTSPNGTGTLAAVYGTYPCAIEVGGGDGRTSTLLDNVHINNFRGPSVNHNRKAFYASKATIRNLHVDGHPTDSAAAFSSTLVDISECDVEGLFVERLYGVRVTIAYHVVLNNTSRCVGLDFHGRTAENPGIGWVGAFNHSEISNSRVYMTSTTGTSAVAAVQLGVDSSLFSSEVWADGDYGTALVIGGSAVRIVINGNRLFWKKGVAADIITTSGFAALVTSNQCTDYHATTPTNPTVSVTGTNALSANNLLASISGAVPTNPV